MAKQGKARKELQAMLDVWAASVLGTDRPRRKQRKVLARLMDRNTDRILAVQRNDEDGANVFCAAVAHSLLSAWGYGSAGAAPPESMNAAGVFGLVVWLAMRDAGVVDERVLELTRAAYRLTKERRAEYPELGPQELALLIHDEAFDRLRPVMDAIDRNLQDQGYGRLGRVELP